MGSTIGIRIKGIADYVVNGYSSENVSIMEKILKYAYITNGAQDSCISNTFNGFNQLAFNLMKLYQEATQGNSNMKHQNGESIPYSNSIYMYPVGTLNEDEVDWLIYEGDNIPMWGYKKGSSLKWKREMSFHNAKSIKMAYTKYCYDEDSDREWTEDIVFDSIGNLYDFKMFFYKRWNELKCVTELDMRNKFTKNFSKNPILGFINIKDTFNNRIIKEPSYRFAHILLGTIDKYNLKLLEYGKKENITYNFVDIYTTNDGYYGFKVSYNKNKSIKQRIKTHNKNISHNKLIYKYFFNEEKINNRVHFNPKDRIIGKVLKDGSFWFVIKKPLLTDSKIEYIMKKIYGY